jgi:hypothetical protein
MALVNRDKKYIFFHLYKTAGNSLRPLLSGEELLGVHCHVNDLKRHYESKGETEFWDSCTKFTFIRNPYDWQVSLYFYVKRAGSHRDNAFANSHSFVEYLRFQRDVRMKEERPHGSNKYDTLLGFLQDPEGNLLVDHVLRTEDYEKDAEMICNVIGEEYKALPPKNVSGNRERDYRKYYNEESKRLVEEIFGEDIKHFNYKF